MEFSENEILNEHLRRLELEKDEIKKEIKNFFEQNKKRVDIGMLMIETFDYKISDFRNKYISSVPKFLLNNPILIRVSIVKTIDIYLDLARYPAELIKKLDD